MSEKELSQSEKTVLEYLKEIKKLSNNPPKAHAMEDEMNEYVLDRVEEGDPKSQNLAKLAKQSRELQFPRWFA